MGLDLALLPFECDLPDLSFAHSIIQCERRGELFNKLMKIKDTPVQNFSSYLSTGKDGGYCYGKTTETPYGEPLTYVLTDDLLTFRGDEGVTGNFRNKAAWSYLAELPQKTKVALYWH